MKYDVILADPDAGQVLYYSGLHDRAKLMRKLLCRLGVHYGVPQNRLVIIMGTHAGQWVWNCSYCHKNHGGWHGKESPSGLAVLKIKFWRNE